MYKRFRFLQLMNSDQIWCVNLGCVVRLAACLSNIDVNQIPFRPFIKTKPAYKWFEFMRKHHTFSCEKQVKFNWDIIVWDSLNAQLMNNTITPMIGRLILFTMRCWYCQPSSSVIFTRHSCAIDLFETSNSQTSSVLRYNSSINCVRTAIQHCLVYVRYIQ